MEHDDPVTPPWEIESNGQMELDPLTPPMQKDSQMELDDPLTPPPPTQKDSQMELDDPLTPPPPTDDDGQSFLVFTYIQKSSYVLVPTVVFSS